MYSTFLLNYNVNGGLENLGYHETMHEALLVYFHLVCLVRNQDAAGDKIPPNKQNIFCISM